MHSESISGFFDELKNTPERDLDIAMVNIALEQLITKTSTQRYVREVGEAVVRVNGFCASGIKRKIVLCALHAGVTKLSGYPDSERPLPNGAYRYLQRDFSGAIDLMNLQKNISDPVQHADDIAAAELAITSLKMRDSAFPQRYRLKS